MYGEKIQAFLDVLYDVPPTGPDQVVIVGNGGSEGGSVPCKHIGELTL